MSDDKIRINGVEYAVLHERSEGGRAYAVVEERRIRIRLPLDLDREESSRVFRDLLERVRERLERDHRRRDAYGNLNLKLEDNEELEIMGHKIKIEINDSGHSRMHARLLGNRVIIDVQRGLDEAERAAGVNELGVKAIARYFVPVIRERLDILNALHFKETFNNVGIRVKNTNWGSCTGGRRNISINFKVLLAPDPVIEYVLIHELAHLKEHNHSERFWELVRKAMPGYSEQARWLRENGHRLGYTPLV